ncbi:MAG: damage-inducible protein CinA [Sulfurimonas sp.]|nr:MAG: damage-inducible protein CinA [Sulfurimonas sp.]
MKLHLLFIGNKFIYNTSLKEYILREIEKKCDFIRSITYYQEGDNSLFLYLEKELELENKLMIITTKNNFSTVGKLISTITSDNQVLKDTILVPSKVDAYEERSYLLLYKQASINVIAIDEMQKMPNILLNLEANKETINIFNEDRESALALLNPLAQTHDVNVEMIDIIDGWIRVEIEGKKYGNIANFIESTKQLIPQKVVTNSNIIIHIIKVLSKNQKKISFAESCTGGLLSYHFTSHNGASQILDGSLVTYSNDLKDNWLGVSHESLEEFGAVSEEVVEQMSEGAMNVSHADYTISVSGIAGDLGGTDLKPVGTVYISVRTKDKHKEVHLQLKGDRNYVQHQSVLYAIKLLLSIDKEIFF